MEETSQAIIQKIIHRYNPPRLIESGYRVSVHYDVSELSPNDLARLAAEAMGHEDSEAFDVALGLAYTGILFASALAGGRQVGIIQTDGPIYGPPVKGKKVIIVGDVVYSGKSLERGKQIAEGAGATVVGFACVVDRSGGKVGTPECPLWSALQTILE